MEIGQGMYPPEHMKEILEAKDRQAAGPYCSGQRTDPGGDPVLGEEA